jgi:predicted dienelactone hydrolase
MQSFRSILVVIGMACCAWILPGAAPVWAAEEVTTRIGGIDVVVWTPSAVEDKPLAVVLFSHALLMCPTQSRYLTSALADAGYLVIAPRHADSSCAPFAWPSLSRMSLKPAFLWSDEDYRDRADDIRSVIDGLREDPHYHDLADLSRLALVGHSLGGYTVLGLGGAWPSWRLPGVRGIVALTPYSLPFERSEGLRHISVPVMYQMGTLDPIFTLPLEHFGYAQTPNPKYLVEFTSSSHMAWTDFGISDRDEIVAYALAFLDHFVRDEPGTPALYAALPGVSILWHD